MGKGCVPCDPSCSKTHEDERCCFQHCSSVSAITQLCDRVICVVPPAPKPKLSPPQFHVAEPLLYQ